MAMSLLAGGKQVPARQKPAGQAIADPVVQPAKPIEIAAPAWLQPILDKIAQPEEKEEKADDQALTKALDQLQAQSGTVAQLIEKLAREMERSKTLQAKIDDLQAQLVAARAQPKPVSPQQKWDTIRVVRGADGLMRDLKLVKE